MANKFPVSLNLQQQLFEELPAGDNLDLSLSGIYDGVSAGTPGQVLRRISSGTQIRWTDDAGGNELKVLANTSNGVAAAGSADFTIEPGNVFNLLSIQCSFPCWVRVYDSASARTADTRTIPGAPYPAAGSGFYTEVVTTINNQIIRMSPIPVCQSTAGLTYIRIVNMDTATRNITTTFNVLTLN